MSRSLRWTDLIIFTKRFARLEVVSLRTLSRNSCLVLFVCLKTKRVPLSVILPFNILAPCFPWSTYLFIGGFSLGRSFLPDRRDPAGLSRTGVASGEGQLGLCL